MENRAAPENKRYTLTDEILDTVIRLKGSDPEEMYICNYMISENRPQ